MINYYVLKLLKNQMPNPNALYEDMDKLNMLYEEMMWDPDSELEFKADYANNQIIIRQKEES